MAIPNVDLAEFLSGDPQREAKFVQDLGQAYETVGFVSVKNHGIPLDVRDKFYDAVKAFFAMPDDVKAKYEIPGLAGQRGYTSFGKEHAKDSDAPDLKEFWQIGQEVEGDDPEVRAEYPYNVTVDEAPDFHVLGNGLYREFEKSGGHLLRAIALYLGLDEHYFEKPIHNGNSILRAIHYPPITEEPESAIRAERHEDINLITLLVGASAEGLQVMDMQGNWVDATADPDDIIVNVGDMLQRLTNDKLRSTTHRVVNPPREKWHTDRFSIPFFLHPRSEMDLSCLDSCIDEEHPKKYEDMTAGAYLKQRLVEIGLLSED